VNPPRTALACPYCHTPVALGLHDFNPTQKLIFCGSCRRALRFPGPARVWGLVTLLLVMAAEIVFLKDFGVWEPDDFPGIALKVALFVGVVFSSSLLGTLVCRLFATLLVKPTGYAATLVASPAAAPAAPVTPFPILLLVAGLNQLLYIGTLTAALALGERVSALEKFDSPYVLAYEGIYVQVSPDVYFWIRLHEWVTAGLAILTLIVIFYGTVRRRQGQVPGA
jgi:hypothetical protein